MKMKKRFLSILLTLALVLGLMPGMSLTAYAETKNIAVGTVYSQGDVINFGSGAYVNRGSYTNNITGNWTVQSLYYASYASTWKFDIRSGSSGWDIRCSNTDTNTDAPSGVKCSGGDGTQGNPYTFTTYREVTLSPSTATLTVGGDAVALTADVDIAGSTDKTVTWSVNNSAVKLYSDSTCETEVGTNVVSTLTVYAKGISGGNATVTVTSNADNTKSASCAVTVHGHSFTYSLSEDKTTITATCGGTGTCDITEGLTLTISAPTGSLVYDGTTTYPATLSTGYNTTAFPDTYTISYTKDGSAYSGVPKDAGTYTASVTAGTGDGAKTASVGYTIAKAAATVTKAPTAKTLTYTGSPQALVSAGTAEGGEMQYALGTDDKTAPDAGWSTSIPSKTDAGTYSVWYKVAGDENHNDTAQSCVTVTISDDKKTEPPAPAPAAPAVSGTFTIGGMMYNIQNGSATVTGMVNKNAKKAVIPDTVVANGQTIPVTAIAPKAFYKMKKLTSATIGVNIEKIGAKAFFKCEKLRKIKIKTQKLKKKSVGGSAFGKTHPRAKVKVPKKKRKAYKKFLYKKGLKKSAKIK